MKVVIYDSAYGNTKLIAEAIATTLGSETKCVSVDDVQPADLGGDFIAIGCPINAWHPTAKIALFLDELLPEQLKGIKTAAFDTRVQSIFSGDAAKKIAKGMKKAGATLVVPPEGFYVDGKEGPLLEGEKERAIKWAETIKAGL